MTPATPLDAMLASAAVFIFGLLIGSFLNVVIHRLPAHESIVWPGSRCPKCGHALSAWENVPVVSWLCLGGKCRACQGAISWRYPATELATAALFLSVHARFGLTWQTGFLLVWIALLVVTFWIDIDHMLIFDAITVPGAVLGLLYSAFVTGTFADALAAALYAVAVLVGINALTLLFLGRDGIGTGDLTLVAMLGAWLGVHQTLLALAFAMVAGAAMGLGLLFVRWARERAWQPFAIALAVGLGLFAALSVVFGGLAGYRPLEALAGLGLSAWTRGAFAGVSALCGASAGWFYMRLTREDGFLEMPFGPALVLGALGSLFWGMPLIDWYWKSLAL